MDGSHFDNLTRSLAISRRSALKQLAAGILAGAGGLLGVRVTGAQACADLRRRCAADGDCCSGFCDPAGGRCACPAGTDSCGGACIPLDQYQSDAENCGGCRTSCRRASECHAPACIAGVCAEVPDPAMIDSPCGPFSGGVYGVCTADGACVCPSHLPTQCGRGCVETLTDSRNCGACDNRCPNVPHASPICTGGVCGFACDAGYFECGGGCCSDARNCCDGICCGPGECCRDGVCSFDACGPHCTIDGAWIADGTINPGNLCEICDPDRDETNWSNQPSGAECGESGQCCYLGLCQECGCLIGETPVAAGALNPENSCENCDPVLDATAWSPLSDVDCGNQQVCCAGICCDLGACCTVDGACETCRCVIDGRQWDDGEFNTAHDCQFCDLDTSSTSWTPASDYLQCGGTPGRVCCNAECCSPTECCTATGCVECGPLCRIDNRDYLENEVNPEDQCQICDPDVFIYTWVDAPDDFPCGGLDDDRVCCRGLCCDPGECCDDGCKPCRCHIGGFPWDAGTRNPLNHCELCDPERSQDAWSPAINGAGCGDGDARACCEGQCCPAGQCCNDIGECADCPCRINGQDWADGAPNPSNTCQVCNSSENREDWTVLGNGEACGTDDDDRVCCNGTCCPQGQCCEDGACVDCGCEINGATITPGTINDDNTCQICDPTRARLNWSPVENGTTCGANGERCCGGDCCENDECCILDACGTCLCQIDGANVPAETINLENVCEVCDPESDPFGWSAATDGAECGDDRVCCSGSCCDPGLCCNLGICQFCGCLIGEEQIAEFAINPDNECQWCDPVLDPLGWSPRSDEPCGDEGDQVCCNGLCCGQGYCCDLNNACAPCPCEIGGATYGQGTANPLNACQICDSLTNRNDWTDAPDNTTCGLTGDQFCCAGSCCPEGECCHALDGACGADPCHCTIGEDEIAEGEINPQNECERCDPSVDPTGWTQLDRNEPCGVTGSQVCCDGTCCADGHCCNLGICGLCGCLIDGVGFAAGDVNPDNMCEVCDPVLDQFAWSPVVDDSPCGEDLDRQCCDGICCPLNWCCLPNGVCDIEFCRPECTINGVDYLQGTVNPDNDCEMCDPSVSETSWTPNNNLRCGANHDLFCCNSVCCEFRSCCDESTSLCTAGIPPCDGCTVDGAFYFNGESNPSNTCQICNTAISSAAWSNGANNSTCGVSQDQFCCEGVCCAANTCCDANGACAFNGSAVCEGCVIDGVFWPDRTRNPANPTCQICATNFYTNAWTTVCRSDCCATLPCEHCP